MGEIWHLTSQIRLSWKFLMVLLHQQGHYSSKGENWAPALTFIYHRPKLYFLDRVSKCPSASSARISKRKRDLKRRRERERENQMKRAGCSFFYVLVRTKSGASLGIINTEDRTHSSPLLPIHKLSSQVTLNSSIGRHRRAASQPVWRSGSSPNK